MTSWWTWDRFLKFFLAGVALATAGAFFGGLTWWLDILADLKMQIALAGMVLFVSALALRRRMEAVLALALVVLNAAALAPYISPLSEGLMGNPQKTMKIVAFNVNRYNPDTLPTLDFLRRENADVVVLAEVNDTFHKALKQLSDLYPHQFFAPLSQSAGHNPNGLGVLSKRAWEDKGVVWSDFTSRAIAVWVRFQAASPSLTVAGVHLLDTLLHPASQQEAEAKVLTSMVNRFDGPVVVAGDFNMTPLSTRFGALLQNTRLRRAGGGLNTTWPSLLTPMGLSLDHILVGKGIGSAVMRTGPRLGSDHLPVVGTFVLGK